MSIANVTIKVPNLEELIGKYDKIQVHRSVTGKDGIYAEITAEKPLAARVNGSIEGPWDLAGLPLSIVLSSAEPIEIEFEEDFIDLLSLIDFINNIKPSLAEESHDGANTISIVSPITGTASTVQVSGDAKFVLGLPGDKVYGKARRISLSPITEEYTFKDLDGSSDYWYKWRFYSSHTGALSEFSEPTIGNPETVAVEDNLATVVARMMNGQGKPIVGRRVTFVPLSVEKGLENSEGNNYVSIPSVDRIESLTDSFGIASTILLRGARFKAFIEGSSYHREIVVPKDPEQSTFDLFELLSDQPDPFSIVKAPSNPIKVSN